MITFVTDNEKNNSPLEDESPDIGLSQKGQPRQKMRHSQMAKTPKTAKHRALQRKK